MIEYEQDKDFAGSITMEGYEINHSLTRIKNLLI